MNSWKFFTSYAFWADFGVLLLARVAGVVMGVPFVTNGDTSCFLLILICNGSLHEDEGVVGVEIWE